MNANALPSFTSSAPGQGSPRTAAALGLDGKNAATWQLRGVRLTAVPGLQQIWQGPTDFPSLPAVAGSLTIVSDAATDSAAGSGARTVAVIYINARGEIREGRVTMDGLTPAPVLAFDQVTQSTGAAIVDALRVISVDVLTVGATGNNDGVIDTLIAGSILARIPRTTDIVSLALLNRARPGFFMVPAGFCALLDYFDPGAAPGTSAIAVQARPPRQAWVGVTSAYLTGVPIVDPVNFESGTELRLVYQQPSGTPFFAQPKASLYLHPDATSTDTAPQQIPPLSRCGFEVP